MLRRLNDAVGYVLALGGSSICFVEMTSSYTPLAQGRFGLIQHVMGAANVGITHRRASRMTNGSRPNWTETVLRRQARPVEERAC